MICSIVAVAQNAKTTNTSAFSPCTVHAGTNPFPPTSHPEQEPGNIFTNESLSLIHPRNLNHCPQSFWAPGGVVRPDTHLCRWGPPWWWPACIYHSSWPSWMASAWSCACGRPPARRAEGKEERSGELNGCQQVRGQWKHNWSFSNDIFASGCTSGSDIFDALWQHLASADRFTCVFVPLYFPSFTWTWNILASKLTILLPKS